MKELNLSKELSYDSDVVYSVVADIVSYNDIFDYVESVDIVSSNADNMSVIVRVCYKSIKLSYNCEVKFDYPYSIYVRSTDYPFVLLEVFWLFNKTDRGVVVDYKLRYKMRSFLLEKIAAYLIRKEMQNAIYSLECYMNKKI